MVHPRIDKIDLEIGSDIIAHILLKKTKINSSLRFLLKFRLVRLSTDIMLCDL